MSRRDREWFARLRLLLLGAVSWYALTIVGELIGNQANSTVLGQTVGRLVLLVGIVLVPTFIVVWAWHTLRVPRRGEIEANPQPIVPPIWRRPPGLCGRRTEVAAALRLVRANGIVVVIGERDVGTSSVGQAVAQELIDHHGVDPGVTTRFDLRSRSASKPDDAVVTAGRVVSVFGIDRPADDSAEGLAKVARELVGVFRAPDGTLLLDNVSTPEQVAWLVREWPSTGPRLVIVGDTALADLAGHSTVEVDPMSIDDMRALWRAARRKPHRPWYRRPPFVHRPEPAELDDLLKACLGRPRAVLAFAQLVGRPGSTETVPGLLARMREEGPAEGTVDRVWRAILANVRAGLSPEAERLLSALAELPVTSLLKGAAAAMLGVNGEPAALAELRSRHLVEEVDGRYRLPEEYRRAIQSTTEEEVRRAVAAKALPALLGFYREYAEQWAARLEVDPEGARRWFEESEPSFRPLYSAKYPDDDLLRAAFDDLSAIADALARWYARERLSRGLLAVHEGLHDLAERVGWLDVAALAAIRTATAHRMERQFGDAVKELDMARTHIEQVSNPRVRADLDARERLARALVAIDRGTGLPEALTELSQPKASPAVLINVGVLCLARGEPGEALEHLLLAEERAQDTGDDGARAHSVELQGVVLSQRNLVEAVRAWQQARTTFARIGERQGEARCLQHLGAAALTDAHAAGQLLRGNPEPVDPREAALEALRLLQKAKTLRPRHPDNTLVNYYISLARRRVEGSA